MESPWNTPAVAQEIERHNRQWTERVCRFATSAPPPWWHRHGVLTEEIRYNYQKWLPVQEFTSSLRRVARKLLPDDSWIPRLLLTPLHSLPDLWQALPRDFCNRCVFRPRQFFPLFCALADPPQFGTDIGRYPQQLQWMKQLLQKSPSIQLLDIGCGVGLNTLELAFHLPAYVTGITDQPLELWMAQNQCLPHDPIRQAHFAACHPLFPVHFMLGSAEHLPIEKADVIVCNGLIGGNYFSSSEQFLHFLQRATSILNPQGHIFIACKFHQGRQKAIEQFQALAGNMGFTCSGTWQNFMLKLGPVEEL